MIVPGHQGLPFSMVKPVGASCYARAHKKVTYVSAHWRWPAVLVGCIVVAAIVLLYRSAASVAAASCPGCSRQQIFTRTRQLAGYSVGFVWLWASRPLAALPPLREVRIVPAPGCCEFYGPPAPDRDLRWSTPGARSRITALRTAAAQSPPFWDPWTARGPWQAGSEIVLTPRSGGEYILTWQDGPPGFPDLYLVAHDGCTVGVFRMSAVSHLIAEPCFWTAGGACNG